jgi:hypothetical protein
MKTSFDEGTGPGFYLPLTFKTVISIFSGRKNMENLLIFLVTRNKSELPAKHRYEWRLKVSLLEYFFILTKRRKLNTEIGKEIGIFNAGQYRR